MADDIKEGKLYLLAVFETFYYNSGEILMAVYSFAEKDLRSPSIAFQFLS